MASSNRLLKLTTWNLETGPILDWVASSSEKVEDTDRIDYLLSMYSSEDVKRAKTLNRDIYIGLYNRRPESGPIECSIKMREISQLSVIPEEIKK